MSRLALAATRAVKVLNLLAAHPTESFALSELSTRLGINVASMHGLLMALTENGYLVRDSRTRAFRLGPAVVALGTAALETHPAIDVAREAARELAASTGLEVALTSVAGEEIVFLARMGKPSPSSVSLHVGQRMPLVPPLGSVFVAWGDAEPWLARATDPAPLRAELEATRERGYSVALGAESQLELGNALDALAATPADVRLQDAVEELVGGLNSTPYHPARMDEASSYGVSMIAAPVFDSTGEVVVALTLLGFPGPLSGADVARYGELVRSAARTVTRRNRGRPPAGPAPS